MPYRTRLVVIALAIVCAPVAAFGQDPVADAPPFWRVQEAEDGARVSLEMVIRRFERAEDEPTISLAAAVHIGEPAFYDELQLYLDGLDLVLFEGIRPPGSGDLASFGPQISDAKRATITTRRIRFLATAIERHRRSGTGLPASLKELIEALPSDEAALVRGAAIDGWGTPIAWMIDAETDPDRAQIGLFSFGADGEPGGDGAAADLRFADQQPLTPEEVGEADGEGLQAQLAEALGLVFQLNAMSHDRPHWHNSDLSLDQLQERLAAAGADPSALVSMLDGSSFGAKLTGMVLKLISMSPSMSALGRIAIIEMLSRADEMLALAPGMEELTGVILEERNDVVLRDLFEAVAGPDAPERIGVIYGAGHLAAIQATLLERGYTPAEDLWVPAITVDAGDANMTARQMSQTRQMLRGVLDQQIRTLRRQEERRGR